MLIFGAHHGQCMVEQLKTHAFLIFASVSFSKKSGIHSSPSYATKLSSHSWSRGNVQKKNFVWLKKSWITLCFTRQKCFLQKKFLPELSDFIQNADNYVDNKKYSHFASTLVKYRFLDIQSMANALGDPTTVPRANCFRSVPLIRTRLIIPNCQVKNTHERNGAVILHRKSSREDTMMNITLALSFCARICLLKTQLLSSKVKLDINY